MATQVSVYPTTLSQQLGALHSSLHLSHLPATLPCRESQQTSIRQFLTTHLDGNKGGSLYVSGAPGTGKSASVEHVIHDMYGVHILDGSHTSASPVRTSLLARFSSSASSPITANCNDSSNSPRIIYCNAMTLCRHPRSLYPKLLAQLEGLTVEEETNIAPMDALQRLQQRFCPDANDAQAASSDRMTLIVLDEVDGLLSGSTPAVLYSLLEWPFAIRSRVVVVAISNSINLLEQKLPHLATRGAAPISIVFSTYSMQELKQIVMERCNSIYPPTEEEKAKVKSTPPAAAASQQKKKTGEQKKLETESRTPKKEAVVSVKKEAGSQYLAAIKAEADSSEEAKKEESTGDPFAFDLEETASVRTKGGRRKFTGPSAAKLAAQAAATVTTTPRPTRSSAQASAAAVTPEPAASASPPPASPAAPSSGRPSRSAAVKAAVAISSTAVIQSLRSPVHTTGAEPSPSPSPSRVATPFATSASIADLDTPVAPRGASAAAAKKKQLGATRNTEKMDMDSDSPPPPAAALPSKKRKGAPADEKSIKQEVKPHLNVDITPHKGKQEEEADPAAEAALTTPTKKAKLEEMDSPICSPVSLHNQSGSAAPVSIAADAFNFPLSTRATPFFEDEALDFLCAKVSKSSGDLRKVLEIARKAVDSLQVELESRVLLLKASLVQNIHAPVASTPRADTPPTVVEERSDGAASPQLNNSSGPLCASSFPPLQVSLPLLLRLTLVSLGSSTDQSALLRSLPAQQKILLIIAALLKHLHNSKDVLTDFPKSYARFSKEFDLTPLRGHELADLLAALAAHRLISLGKGSASVHGSSGPSTVESSHGARSSGSGKRGRPKGCTGLARLLGSGGGSGANSGSSALANASGATSSSSWALGSIQVNVSVETLEVAFEEDTTMTRLLQRGKGLAIRIQAAKAVDVARTERSKDYAMKDIGE